jgi:hypothetical protein
MLFKLFIYLTKIILSCLLEEKDGLQLSPDMYKTQEVLE